LKFGDVVTAVASLAVIMVLVSFPLEMVLVPALGSDWGPYVNLVVSVLLSALIGGYIFAGKIWEARMEAVTKITVLAATLMIFYIISFPALAHWNLTVEEAYEAANPGTTLSTTEWLTVESMALSQTMFIYIVMVLVLGFIGLYVGSMLRRPVKNGK
jgi:hypothetical protein